jgi:hypothetical protein
VTPRARRALAVCAPAALAALAITAPPAPADVSTLGGPVMHSERTHVVFWEPAGSGLSFDPGYEQTIETFLARVAAASRTTGNIFGLIGQYRGAGGPAAYDSTYAGAVLDPDPLPTGSRDACSEPLPPPLGPGPGWTRCVDDAALQSELTAVVQSHGLPVGLDDVYLLVLPSGFASCVGSGPSACALGGDADGGYCGYHQEIGSARIVYAVIPYNAVAGHCRSGRPRPNGSAADPTISTIAHELAESATDPLGDAWTDDSGDEIADICLSRYGPALAGSAGSTAYNEVIDGGHYYLQELWSNAAHRCEPRAAPDRVAITAPARARTGVGVPFAAAASAGRGHRRRIVSYAWTFGDGGRRGRARGARVMHRFARRGRFEVTLTVTDSWGNRASATRRIRIGALGGERRTRH